MSETLLTVENLTVRYGPVTALKHVDLHVDRGEIVALVGANGAGKSTLLKTLSGLIRPAEGSIMFASRDLTRTAPHKIVETGLVHVPEGRHVFSKFSMRDNLIAGAFSKDFKKAGKRADAIIAATPILTRRSGSLAGQLSGGEQQMLVIQRALMADPVMLMLDEPSMGLSPLLADQVLELVCQLREHGMTVLLVEQNARAALEVADRVYALATGDIRYSGGSNELSNDAQFAEQFLGVVSADADRRAKEQTGSGTH